MKCLACDAAELNRQMSPDSWQCPTCKRWFADVAIAEIERLREKLIEADITATVAEADTEEQKVIVDLLHGGLVPDSDCWHMLVRERDRLRSDVQWLLDNAKIPLTPSRDFAAEEREEAIRNRAANDAKEPTK